jgi:hypothetical protein
VNESSYFPNSLDVDYVRVWYKEGTSKSREVLGKKQSDFSYLKLENNKEAAPKKRIKYMYDKKAFKDDLLTVSVLPSPGKKLIVTSLGKDVNYTFTVLNPAGKELLKKEITTSFSEFDLSQVATHQDVKVKIKTSCREIEETISLK